MPPLQALQSMSSSCFCITSWLKHSGQLLDNSHRCPDFATGSIHLRFATVAQDAPTHGDSHNAEDDREEAKRESVCNENGCRGTKFIGCLFGFLGACATFA